MRQVLYFQATELFKGSTYPKIKSITEFAIPYNFRYKLAQYREAIAIYLKTTPDLIKLSSPGFYLESMLDEYVVLLDSSDMEVA